MGARHIREYGDILEKRLIFGQLSRHKYVRLKDQLTLWELNSYRVEVLGEQPYIDDFLHEDWDFDEDELEYDDY